MEDADLACLRAAKQYGLIRKSGGNLACPTSATPSFGWWARSSWSEYQPDARKGGPWSVERVHSLCERGFLGVGHDKTERAVLTKAGTAQLRPPKTLTLAPTPADPGSQPTVKEA